MSAVGHCAINRANSAQQRRGQTASEHERRTALSWNWPPVRTARCECRGHSNAQERDTRMLATRPEHDALSPQLHDSPVTHPATTLDAMKKRLDVLLVERGLAESRAQAQALVLAGLVPGYDKPGHQVPEDAELAVKERPRFVSRGGEKLANALEQLDVELDGRDAHRRRRVDGRLHRLPAPARGCARARGRRRLRPAPPEAARRPEGDRAGAHERPRADRAARSAPTCSSPTSRSSASGSRCRRCCGCSRRAGTRSCS